MTAFTHFNPENYLFRCTYTHHLDKVLEEAAATFYPHIKFVRVECPKYPGFCLTRQRNEYPFVEVFYNPEQAASQGKSVDPNITKYPNLSKRVYQK
ncbi:hypothetical protein GQ55_3G216800 [Panicum hallii var. hallii]|uniref:Thioredoxin domain-containing protein n=1 Tax=Panicum hallii var. hallii TaxID=1504633 RepID=A0A2T7EC12_9POAL|nr:hypothetical protein GQ55_3G216800 [Panicum hallii var. hallii]